MDGSANQKRRAENNRHVAGFCITPESCTWSVQCALAVAFWSAGRIRKRRKSKSRQDVSCFLIWGFCSGRPFKPWTAQCAILKLKMTQSPKSRFSYGVLSYLSVRAGWLCTVCVWGLVWLTTSFFFTFILHKKEIPSKFINYGSLSALSVDPEEWKFSYRNWMSRGCWQERFILGKWDA